MTSLLRLPSLFDSSGARWLQTHHHPEGESTRPQPSCALSVVILALFSPLWPSFGLRPASCYFGSFGGVSDPRPFRALLAVMCAFSPFGWHSCPSCLVEKQTHHKSDFRTDLLQGIHAGSGNPRKTTFLHDFAGGQWGLFFLNLFETKKTDGLFSM